jgi:hypothetical protein
MAILTFALISAYLTVIVAYAYFAPTVAYKTKAKAKAVRLGVIETLLVSHFRICEYRFPVSPRQEIKTPATKMTHVTVRHDGLGPKVQTFEQPAPKPMVIPADVRISIDNPFWAVCAVQVCTMLKLTPPARRVVTIIRTGANSHQVTETIAR